VKQLAIQAKHSLNIAARRGRTLALAMKLKIKNSAVTTLDRKCNGIKTATCGRVECRRLSPRRSLESAGLGVI
jgi:hypothetical protein